MPIRSKHTLGGGRPIAARQFTDREDFIAAFRKALAEARAGAGQLALSPRFGGGH